MDYITSQIRVYPLVLKYLCHHYDTKPFVLGASQNTFAAFLWACLERYPYPAEPASYRKLTATLTVGMTKRMARSGFGRYLSPEKVVAFNNFVKKAFLDQLVQEVAIYDKLGYFSLETVRQILDRYDITESELSYQTAYRYYLRNRPAKPLNSVVRRMPVSPDIRLAA